MYLYLPVKKKEYYTHKNLWNSCIDDTVTYDVRTKFERDRIHYWVGIAGCSYIHTYYIHLSECINKFKFAKNILILQNFKVFVLWLKYFSYRRNIKQTLFDCTCLDFCRIIAMKLCLNVPSHLFFIAYLYFS